MMSDFSNENKNAQPTIIYKTYTPQRKEYAQKYYQKNKELLQSKQKGYYESNKEFIKQNPEIKEQHKIAVDKYMNKLKEDPERLAIYKLKRKEYYKIKNSKERT
jgi:O-glycosyl hydrolase